MSDQLCSGGWYVNQTVGSEKYVWIGLFNNDSIGRSLYVYDIDFAMDAAQSIAAVMSTGIVGAVVANCVSINPLLGAPPGQITLTLVGPSVPPTVGQAVPSGTAFVLGSGFFNGRAHVEHPLAIIPPGYSLTLTGDFQTADAGVGFWYVPLRSN